MTHNTHTHTTKGDFFVEMMDAAALRSTTLTSKKTFATFNNHLAGRTTTTRRRRTPKPPHLSSSSSSSSGTKSSSKHPPLKKVASSSSSSTSSSTTGKDFDDRNIDDDETKVVFEHEGQTTTRTRRVVAVAFGACLSSAFSAAIFGTQDEEPSSKGRTLTFLGRRRQSNNGVVEAAEFNKGVQQQKDCENCSNSNTSLREGDKKFATSPSGLRYIDLREGDGTKVPKRGDVVVVDWVGYTAGYQAKKIESTRDTDAPFTFTVGSGEAIPAFDEAVLTMGKGGVKRIEIAGELEETLGYSRNPKERYDGVGPKPTTFGGLRALDFVLDNKTLKDFNRTLLFDVKLVSIRNNS